MFAKHTTTDLSVASSGLKITVGGNVDGLSTGGVEAENLSLKTDYRVFRTCERSRYYDQRGKP